MLRWKNEEESELEYKRNITESESYSDAGMEENRRRIESFRRGQRGGEILQFGRGMRKTNELFETHSAQIAEGRVF
jgi:hypothetical protein